jgi:hypothetical protein
MQKAVIRRIAVQGMEGGLRDPISIEKKKK